MTETWAKQGREVRGWGRGVGGREMSQLHNFQIKLVIHCRCVCVCVCVRACVRARARARVCVCVCLPVCERGGMEREGEGERRGETDTQTDQDSPYLRLKNELHLDSNDFDFICGRVSNVAGYKGNA